MRATLALREVHGLSPMPGLEVLTAATHRLGITGQGYARRPDRRVGEQALQTAAVRVMPAVIRASAHPALPVARCALWGELTPLTLNIHRISVLDLELQKIFLEFADVRCGSLHLIGEMLDPDDGLDPDGELLEMEGFGDEIVDHQNLCHHDYSSPRWGSSPALSTIHLLRPRLRPSFRASSALEPSRLPKHAGKAGPAAARSKTSLGGTGLP